MKHFEQLYGSQQQKNASYLMVLFVQIFINIGEKDRLGQLNSTKNNNWSLLEEAPFHSFIGGVICNNRIPFVISKTESFYDKLSERIGDLFYDILPEAGFELRDEQIFMAFQLEKAFKEKKVMLAEAGVGTGKTIVYLLYAIAYARYTNSQLS